MLVYTIRCGNAFSFNNNIHRTFNTKYEIAKILTNMDKLEL